MAKKKQIELTIEEKLQNALVPKEEQPYKIPNNWCWVRLESINKYKSETLNPKNAMEKMFELYSVPSFDNKYPEILIGKDIGSNKYIVKKNDILLCKINPRINRVWQVYQHTNFGQICSSEWIVIRNEILNKSFLRYYFTSEYFRNRLCENVSGVGGSLTRAKPKLVQLYEVPLSPINEQQRIVNIIESLFAKLDRAKELIENTLAQWEQNKMAILHKAFTGELTVKWRKENNIDLSSWENGILMDFCKINPKKINTKEFDDDMIVSFIPMPCVSDIWGKIVKKELRKLGEVKKGYTNFCEGDVLFAKITPCMENGKSAIVDKLENDIGFGSTEFYVLRCDENKLNNKYLHYFVRQKTFRDEAKGEMTGAVGQQRVPKTFLENYKMKVPTIEEQQEIVNILDNLLAKYNKIKNLEQQLEKIELLKKAILAKAFRGELGTNNPDEESAENLLKEILAEK
ncbi:restriction endonuclease subunit S [uncultured Megamonas sp.]|uniref:restriction endonuclease subunit S n=1 Tax=uncultured Megamonas sp. TaxID=286140 RepID=UPI002595B767|nr:restriction endonuclease subunit S [uncultured Megamonas sp.]